MTQQPIDTEESCNARVAELFLAWRVISPEGGEFRGAHLLRFRQLPPKERAYFAALVAPYDDPHWQTRTQEALDRGEGRCEVIHTPPYPEACACTAALFVDHSRQAVRCSRCLHASPFSRLARAAQQAAGVPLPPVLRDPIIDSVNRADVGYAIERVLGVGPI